MLDIKIIVGANYGDEGKGLVTDYVCRKAIDVHKWDSRVLNVLANGGCQRGHTVVTKDGKAHVFHHFGAGTFAGADTYFCSRFIINPMRFVDEYNTLATKFNAMPHSCMSSQCRLQLPGDIAANWYLERSRGDNKHGSTGCGIWETVKRFKKSQEKKFLRPTEHDRCAGYTLAEFMNFSDDEKFQIIRESGRYWLELTKVENDIEESYFPYLKLFLNDGFIKHYIEDCKRMFSMCKIVSDKLAFKDYSTVVLEYGQGLLLDPKYSKTKAFSEYGYALTNTAHTTPSYVGAYDAGWAINVAEMSGKTVRDIEVIYVTRPYITRHGADDFKEDLALSKLLAGKDKTNVYNEWQGTIKYKSLDELQKSMLHSRINEDFDKFKHDYAIADHEARKICALTHLDELDDVDLISEFMTTSGMYVSYGPTARDVTTMLS